jgi:hypothetical protein
MEDFEDFESLDELNDKTLQQENDLDQDMESSEIADEAKKPVLRGVKVPRKPRRKKVVIPPEATPLEVFMLEKEFHMGELTAITKLTKEELLDIIRGDMPTEHQRNRIRLTTGVRL